MYHDAIIITSKQAKRVSAHNSNTTKMESTDNLLSGSHSAITLTQCPAGTGLHCL